MADEDGKNDGETKESDEFDPKALSKEAQEYIRREIQSESDTKSQLAETRLRAEVAQNSRSAVENAEQNELRQLAESGQHEALGQRVAARISQNSAEAKAVARASDLIEQQMVDKFSESLGPEKVEQIRRQVVSEKGAHAEFAEALAKAAGGESRSEEIAAEVKAQLMEARGEKRDSESGADKVTGSGQGTKLSTFEEIEQSYVDGKTTRETYETAKKAR